MSVIYKVVMEVSTEKAMTDEELATLRQKLAAVPLDDAFDRAVALAEGIDIEEIS
ncbi:hypothetical protein SEA_MARYSWELL_56 [Mycobacterium phage MarysWell]|nr:hypothetical protein SEA_MARYSWELL_56 [Mycobacterium phage MarysWell]